MKSLATTLGVCASLAATLAYADDSKYWENRSTDRNQPGSIDAASGLPLDQNTDGTVDVKDIDYANAKVDPNAKKVEPENPADRKDLLNADTTKKRFGIGVEAGGGVGGFTDGNISNVTGAQGQWTARMIFGTNRHVAGEAAYVGSAQSVYAAGVSSGATLTGNGGEGMIRWNVLTGMWQPYLIGGIGYMHYSLGDAQLTSADVQSTGDVATFPIGTGMAWRYNGFLLDSRLSLHPATRSALVHNASLTTWDLQARAGFEF